MAESNQDRSFQVALLGRRGYAGQILHAMMMQHPCIKPHVPEAREPTALDATDRRALAACDAVVLALPREPAVAWAAALTELGAKKILDLSDAKRRTPGIHYGIPELFGAPDSQAGLLANPGCYPTATLLALKPLLDAGVIEDHGIAVVGASGTSGAGKSLPPHLHFSELANNFFPYGVGTHRHQPEIEHHLGAPISFVTQLLPVVRGIGLTAFVKPKASPAILVETLHAAYDAAPYVTVLDAPDGQLGLRHVVGTHQARLAVGPKASSGLVPVFAAIDNLMRGAASQALVNLNLWLGLEHDLGLPPPLPYEPSQSLAGMKVAFP